MAADHPARLTARLTALGVLASAGMAAFLVLRRPEVELALHLYLVAMGALAAIGLGARAVAGISAPAPPPGRRRRGRWAAEPVRSLQELENAVDFATTTAFDVHFRLRPHLVRIARHRLALRAGVSLDGDPAAARAALGAELWELVRPDRQPPLDRNASGLSRARLRALVESLERL